MGKRFTVGYGAQMMIGFHKAYANYYSEPGEPTTTFNYTHQLGIGYVVGRRLELCASANYFKTKFNTLSYARTTPELVTSECGLSSLSFSFALKHYHRRLANIAPLGAYSKWELLYAVNNVSYPERYNYDYAKNVAGGNVGIKSVGVAFSLGRQRIFFDKLVLDYGLRGALCFSVGKPQGLGETEGDMYSFGTSEMLHHEFFNVYLGLGFLAF